MIYTSQDNWYSWQYDEGEFFGRRLSGSQQFKSHFSRYHGSILSFKEELQNVARDTMELNLGTPSVMFSGGLDSELVIRSYLDIGVKPNVYIFRYEKDYNLYDVSYAVAICHSLNIDFNLVDFNLQKFYENDAESISEIAQIDRPRALPYCKFLSTVDGFPVLGASDLTAYRTDNDYTRKGTWKIRCWEHDTAWSKYLRAINRSGCAEWFKWTPGIVVSYTRLNWFKRLINDDFFGKLGVTSTKIMGYREAYPDLLHRVKQTGFEKIDTLVNEMEEFLTKKYNGLHNRGGYDRTIDELSIDITGSIYV